MTNPKDYTTPEMSLKLVENGIVLATDMIWMKDQEGRWILTFPINEGADDVAIPAVNFSELWRELPEEIYCGAYYLELQVTKSGGLTLACYGNDNLEQWVGESENINPCDALAELYIWVTEQQYQDYVREHTIDLD